MHAVFSQRHGQTPGRYLVDGGFATIEDITQVEQAGTQVFAPQLYAERIVQRGGDPHARRARDTDEMAAFRQRMASDEAKELYKQRPSIAEFPNAQCRNYGLQQFRVRGLKKVRATSLWYVIVFNFQRLLTLGWLSHLGVA